MDFFEMAQQRYTVRKFAARRVDEATLNKILEAGRVAPTATNAQSQRIIVVKGDEALENLKGSTRCHYNAPLAMIVCYDSRVSWKNFSGVDEGIVDASIVTTHMMLEAWDLGIGSCWVGAYDESELRRRFQIPSEIVPVAILVMGYPADGCEPAPVHFKRLPLESTVSYDVYS